MSRLARLQLLAIAIMIPLAVALFFLTEKAGPMPQFVLTGLDAGRLLFAKWWKAMLGAAIGAALVFPVAQCSGANNERARAEAAQLRANERAMERNTKATEAAGGERLTDHDAVTTLQQDLQHADDQTVDSGPSDARRALACKRLRNQGVREADLAGRCGPAG